MRRLHPEAREAIVSDYRDGHPMLEIAARFGVSLRTVRNLVRAVGLPPRGSKALERTCRNCGKRFNMRPSQAVRSLEVHCGWACYRARMKCLDFQSRRVRSVRLRRLIAEFFPIQEGDFVHHLDGNPGNNDLSNIAVFRRPTDVGKTAPLWRGDDQASS